MALKCMFQKVLFTIFNFVPVIQTFTELFWDFFKGLYILEMFVISTFDKYQPIKSGGNVLLGWLLEKLENSYFSLELKFREN